MKEARPSLHRKEKKTEKRKNNNDIPSKILFCLLLLLTNTQTKTSRNQYTSRKSKRLSNFVGKYLKETLRWSKRNGISVTLSSFYTFRNRNELYSNIIIISFTWFINFISNSILLYRNPVVYSHPDFWNYLSSRKREF